MILKELHELRKDTIECQRTVIKLQQEVIEAKDTQLKSVTATVAEKVGEVTREVRDYSAAVTSNSVGNTGTVLSSSQVQKAVKTALSDKADEESRKCNVVVFVYRHPWGKIRQTAFTLF